MILSFLQPREEANGQVFEMPSLTAPDMAFSISQLIDEYSLPNLPTLSDLVYLTADEVSADQVEENGLETAEVQSFAFADRADEAYLNSYSKNIIDSIKLKYQEMKRYQREKNKDIEPDCDE